MTSHKMDSPLGMVTDMVENSEHGFAFKLLENAADINEWEAPESKRT